MALTTKDLLKEMIFLPVLKMEPTTIRLSKRCKQMAKE